MKFIIFTVSATLLLSGCALTVTQENAPTLSDKRLCSTIYAPFTSQEAKEFASDELYNRGIDYRSGYCTGLRQQSIQRSQQYQQQNNRTVHCMRDAVGNYICN